MTTITTDTLDLTRCVVDCLLDYVSDAHENVPQIIIENGPGSLWDISVPDNWGNVLNDCKDKCINGDFDQDLF